jgi:prolyl-tRNA synthetase
MALENSKEKNFPEWYAEVVQKSEMADYSSVQGCMVVRETAYGVWEKMQEAFNAMIRATGHRNVLFPLFIPKNLLTKEAEHFAGFTPEVAWVTRGGNSELSEPLAVRPTSETIMYESYAKWVHSHRDLPLLLNQWCTVVRWETKATKPFIRTREVPWQEGHTAHATNEETDAEVMLILGFYKKIMEEYLAVPVLLGRKSDGEKFAGALYTTTCEALMPDGKALQCATSHNLGQNFSKPFGIRFKDRDETEQYAWQASWGMSTRTIGALIMTHGDDKGVVIPPAVAPLKAVIIPIAYSKPDEAKKVAKYCEGIFAKLAAAGISVKLDDRDDKSAGWKYNEWELKGVPLRLEVGLKDIGKDAVTMVRRDTGVKNSVAKEGLEKSVEDELDKMQRQLLEKAKKFQGEHTSDAKDYKEFKNALEKNRGFVRMSWCDERECEEAISKETTATVRLIPFGDEARPRHKSCGHCGKPAKVTAYFAKSY